MCLATAPGVFAHNDQRQSEVVDPEGASEEKILEAAFNCPTGAIRVEIAEGGEQLFP
jgi:ferredoxin